MKNLSPAVLVAIIAVVLAVVLLGIYTLVMDKDINDVFGGNEASTIKPVLNLTITTEGENVPSVKIRAEASTEDENGIQKIILPDGSSVEGAVAEYEATENGKLTFKAIGNNNQESTSEIEVTTVMKVGANNPYIPEGFEYVEGEAETGFVIQDEFENQFVWVPISTGMLTINTILPSSSKYIDDNDYVTELTNSVAKYYGFYIARYEASKDDNELQPKIVIKANQEPWTNITYTEANNHAINMAIDYDYSADLKTAIVNRYAYDSALLWINTTVPNYSSNTGYGNYGEKILLTGATETDKVNNIFDLAGNVREWTSTQYEDSALTNTVDVSHETANYRVIRGGSATLSRTAGSYNAYQENKKDDYWGFRVILFKN